MIGYGSPCMTTCTVDMGQLKAGDIPHSTHMCGAEDASHLGEHTCRTCGAPFVGKTGPALNPPAARHERTVDLSTVTEHFRAIQAPPAPPVRRSFRDRKAGQPPTEMQQVQQMLAAHADMIATMQRQQDAQRRIVLGHTDRIKTIEDSAAQQQLLQRLPLFPAIDEIRNARGALISGESNYVQRAMRYLDHALLLLEGGGSDGV